MHCRGFKRSWAWIWASLVVCAASCYAVSTPKVLSLDLCTDWMLAYYADRDQVVALSPMQIRYPEARFSRGWPSHDGSLEHIVTLQPEVIITGQYNALVLRNRLKALGYRVEILPLPKTISDVKVRCV